MIQLNRDYRRTIFPSNYPPESNVCATNGSQPGTKQQALLLQSTAAQPKKACEGSGYRGLSSRALACPNYFNHLGLTYFSASANKNAVGQY